MGPNRAFGTVRVVVDSSETRSEMAAICNDRKCLSATVCELDRSFRGVAGDTGRTKHMSHALAK